MVLPSFESALLQLVEKTHRERHEVLLKAVMAAKRPRDWLTCDPIGPWIDREDAHAFEIDWIFKSVEESRSLSTLPSETLMSMSELYMVNNPIILHFGEVFLARYANGDANCPATFGHSIVHVGLSHLGGTGGPSRWDFATSAERHAFQLYICLNVLLGDESHVISYKNHWRNI